MPAVDATIKKFTTRVRELILQTKQLKEKNAELQSIVAKQGQEIKEKEKQYKELEQKYKTMMTAKMLNITDNDIEGTRRRISKMIRTIDECIALQNARDND